MLPREVPQGGGLLSVLLPVTVLGPPFLEAAWFAPGERVAVVAPPHPLLGGRLDHPVVLALAEGLAEAGIGSLLFNFRGTGESGGDASGDPSDADQDFEHAVAFAARTARVVVFAGYSFGGATAIRAAARRTDPPLVVAVAPPPALFEGTPLGALSGRLRLLAAERDHFAPPAELERAAPGASLERAPGADHFFAGAGDRVRSFARAATDG